MGPLESVKGKVSNEKKHSFLGHVGDYTTQFYVDYYKPLQGSLLNNQYFVESKAFFFCSSSELFMMDDQVFVFRLPFFPVVIILWW